MPNADKTIISLPGRKVPRQSQPFLKFTAEQNAEGEFRLAEIVRLWRGLHLRWAKAA